MSELVIYSASPASTIEAAGGPVLEVPDRTPTLTPGQDAAIVEPGAQPIVRLEQVPGPRAGIDIVGIGPQGPAGGGGSVTPYAVLIGDGSTTVFEVAASTHGQMPVDGIKVRVLSASVGDEWVTYHQVDGDGNVLVAFTNPPGVDQFRLIIEG